MGVQLREEISRQKTVHEIEFQDDLFQFGKMTQETLEFFVVDEKTKRPYPYDDSVHFQLRYEFNLDKVVGERVIYGILDWLGDVGGFLEA